MQEKRSRCTTMIQLSAQGTCLVLVAQGRAFIGEAHLLRMQCLFLFNEQQQILQLRNCNNRDSYRHSHNTSCVVTILNHYEKEGYIIHLSYQSVLCQCLECHFHLLKRSTDQNGRTHLKNKGGLVIRKGAPTLRRCIN